MVKGGRNLVICNLWEENGIGEKPYEEVQVFVREYCNRMRLSSLCADCDEYMVANIDAILWSVNNLFDCKKGIIAERTAMRMTTIYC